MFKKSFLLVLSLFCFILIYPKTSFAKDYSIPSADFLVQINPDGSANVTETRTYNFDGSFSWADEWIELQESRITNFELREGTTRYVQSNLETAGNYSVKNEGYRIYIKWHYLAFNESKTFTLNYKIENAVTNHEDISEFNWQLIGGGMV